MQNQIIACVRSRTPLVHCITNYVTAGDVANMLLAAGGSPIMADGIHEVEEITSICQGLVINIGTLNERTIDSMVKAGKRAAELGHPVVFDPVGAGASGFRKETAMKILSEIPCTVIRGNVSEIRTIAGELGIWLKEDAGSGEAAGGGSRIDGGGGAGGGQSRVAGSSRAAGGRRQAVGSRGVDSSKEDAVTEENLEQMCAFAKELSKKTGAVIAMTGAIDVAADGGTAYVIRNGCSMMGKVTGTGCMLDGVIAAYLCAGLAVGAGEATEAGLAVDAGAAYEVKPAAEAGPAAEVVAAAIAAEGLCGELAYRKMVEHEGGTGSFRMYLLDFMSRLDDEQLERGKNIEIR